MIDKLKEEYEKLSTEFAKLNTELNTALNEGRQDDKLELAVMRKQRELTAKYQEITQAQIKGGGE